MSRELRWSEELPKDFGSGLQRGNGDPLIDAVEHARKIEFRRQLKWDEAVTGDVEATEGLCVSSAPSDKWKHSRPGIDVTNRSRNGRRELGTERSGHTRADLPGHLDARAHEIRKNPMKFSLVPRRNAAIHCRYGCARHRVRFRPSMDLRECRAGAERTHKHRGYRSEKFEAMRGSYCIDVESQGIAEVGQYGA